MQVNDTVDQEIYYDGGFIKVTKSRITAIESNIIKVEGYVVGDTDVLVKHLKKDLGREVELTVLV